MHTSNTYLRSGEVAKLLHVTSRTVWRIPREELAYSRTPGGQRKYHREDVRRYIATLNGPTEEAS